MRRFAVWSADRDLWETDQGDLFSEHSDVFWETWPLSGIWVDGTAYELPTSEHLTDGSGSSSLLPAPRVSDTNGAGPHGTGGPDLRTVVATLA